MNSQYKFGDYDEEIVLEIHNLHKQLTEKSTGARVSKKMAFPQSLLLVIKCQYFKL